MLAANVIGSIVQISSNELKKSGQPKNGFWSSKIENGKSRPFDKKMFKKDAILRFC